jgi:glycosyltransferase involved in cell wall biosynthesis
VTNYEWELFVVDGNSTDGTAEKVRAWSEANGRISLLHNEKKTVPCAMNIGIRQASGDIIIRVDAHAEYDPHYFSYVIEHLAHYDAANVGTRIVTRAKNGSRTGRAIAFVLSDKLGVGNSYFRIGTDTVKEVDTVPFGCYRREIFDEVGLYDERLTKSQDIELNKRIKRSGGSIILLPNHPIIYYSRENYRDLARKYIVNGKWNILVAYYTNSFRSLSYRNFFPLIFFSAVLALALLSVLHGGFGAAAGGLLGLYFLFIMLRSLRKKRGDFPSVFLAYLVLHLSHAAGALWGIFSLLNPKTRRDKKLPKW